LIHWAAVSVVSSMTGQQRQ